MPYAWTSNFEKEVLETLREHEGKMRSGDLMQVINEKRKRAGERNMSPTTLFMKTLPMLESKELVESERVSHKNVFWKIKNTRMVEKELELVKIAEKLGELLKLARTGRRKFTAFVHKRKREKEYRFITPEALAKPNDDVAYVRTEKLGKGAIAFVIGNPTIGKFTIIYEPYGLERSLEESALELLTEE